ncbi:DUF6438 domain-containing protein [Flavobacterium rhizosphaerae]|uniref:DUF6438 domain-containing protein n=1 Tax=Flavobacterium rhizosphaerae TaxID=3163298 RepID=A0ABW8YVE3_9FLAO
MKPYIIIIPFLLLFVSCNKKSNHFAKEIIGDWKFEAKAFNEQYYKKNKLPAPPLIGALGYSFYEDGTYECKNRKYYVPAEKNNEYGDWAYYSGKSKYLIEDDSLKLQNPINKKWECYKLTDISSDTLAIKFGDNLDKKFSRVNYTKTDESNIDQIIISSSGCYGTCPIEALSIDSKGNVLYMGTEYSVKEGFYSAQISVDKFYNILTGFEKAAFENLDDHYYADHTDDETIDITFIKNNTIIKTIEDYGQAAPSEFIWAYLPLRHLIEELKYKNKTVQFENFPVGQIYFRKDKTEGKITKSEMFLLFTEIQKAKITDTFFDKKFSLKIFFDSHIQAIYTDGRYFSLPDNGDKALDLGYNFFERNNLENRLEHVKE